MRAGWDYPHHCDLPEDDRIEQCECEECEGDCQGECQCFDDTTDYSELHQARLDDLGVDDGPGGP
jgi:hypothetical protein